MKWLLPAAAILLLAAFTFQKAVAPARKTCSTCDNLSGVEKIVCLAEDFKASLSASQVTSLQLDRTLANAQKWSNLPVTFVPRLGVRFGDLNATQLEKAKAILQAAMSNRPYEGYDEAQQLWAADEYLAQNGGGSTYGAGQYFMAFLGTPSTTGAWELQSGGHHLAISNTYANGEMSGATPSFRGAEPFSAFTLNGNTYQPLVQERDSLAAALASLSSTELAAAKLTTSFNDIVLGPNKDWQFPATKAGLKCSQLTGSQKSLILAAIRTYVGDIDSANAAAYMALYASQMDNTYIAYANNAALTQAKDYVRIDGPRVWIEFSMQNGVILSGPHPHSVWRDHTSDYGGLGNPTSSTQTALRFTGKFEVFPNPAAATAQVQVELENSAVIAVNLFDSTGKKCTGGFQYNMTAGEHTLPLRLQNLPQGQYNCLLEVKYPNGTLATASKPLTKI